MYIKYGSNMANKTCYPMKQKPNLNEQIKKNHLIIWLITITFFYVNMPDLNTQSK